jgi:hypothetical protein
MNPTTNAGSPPAARCSIGVWSSKSGCGVCMRWAARVWVPAHRRQRPVGAQLAGGEASCTPQPMSQPASPRSTSVGFLGAASSPRNGPADSSPPPTPGRSPNTLRCNASHHPRSTSPNSIRQPQRRNRAPPRSAPAPAPSACRYPTGPDSTPTSGRHGTTPTTRADRTAASRYYAPHRIGEQTRSHKTRCASNPGYFSTCGGGARCG